MLSRLIRQAGSKKPLITNRNCVRSVSSIISNGNRLITVPNDRKSDRLHVVSSVNLQVRYRRFDSKNDPKDDNGSEDGEETQSVRTVYDVKSNPDNTSIATIQVPDELPFLPLVTIAKPPLYPRLFRIVEVCTHRF